MKYLLILLFPTILYATFTSFSTNPTADSITAKGNLLTKTATAQVNFPACPDDEFLIWDSAQGTGMKCSGDNITIAGNLASANGNLYLGLNKGAETQAAIWMFNDGDGVYSAYISQDASNAMRVFNKYGGITFYAASVATLAMNNTQGVTIYETGGNGGNIPHNCTIRSATTTTGISIATCSTGEKAISGGCSGSSGGALYRNRPSATSGFTNQWQCYHTVATTLISYAVCCDY